MKNLKKGMLIIFTFVVLTLTACSNSIKTYKVKFDTTGGSKVETEVVESGSKATKPISPTKDGYVFEGWYIDENTNTEYDFRSSVDKDITLYAKWSKNTCGIVCSKGYKLTDNCKCVKDDSYKEETTTTKTTTTKKNSNTTKKTTTTKKVVTASEVVIPYAKVELKVGEQMELTARVLPDNADNKKVIWSSNDDIVATVSDSGVITAREVGKATIKATVDGISAKCEIIVTKDPVYNALWIPVKDSVIGQYTLFITDEDGYTVEAEVVLTTIDDKTVEEYIDKDGKVYVKSIIKDVKVLNVTNINGGVN